GGGSHPPRTPYRSAGRTIVDPNTFANATFNAGNLKTSFDNIDVVGELNSSFLDKRLLLDIRGGWHHQEDDILPGDGSTINDLDNRAVLGGTPTIRSPTGSNGTSSVLLWDDHLPPSVTTPCPARPTPTP